MLRSIDAAVGGEIGISVLLWWISCSKIVEHAGGGKEWNNSHLEFFVRESHWNLMFFYWVFVDHLDFRLLSFTSGNCKIQTKNEGNAKMTVRSQYHSGIMNERMLKDITQPDPEQVGEEPKLCVLSWECLTSCRVLEALFGYHYWSRCVQVFFFSFFFPFQQ